MSEPIVSDGTHSTGSRVLWGDQGPAYAEGWSDCARSLAAEFDRLAGRPGPPVAIGALAAAAEVARQAQDGPGAPSTPEPVSVATPGRTEALSVAGRSFTRDELVDALTHLQADLPWPPPIRRDGSIALNAETMADSIIEALNA